MRTLQLKRFDRIFSNHETALKNLSAHTSEYKDGEIMAAAYYDTPDGETQSDSQITYVVGLYATKEGHKNLFTIDVKSLEKDIDKVKEFIEKSLKYVSGVTQVTATTYDSNTTDTYNVERVNADDEIFRLMFTPLSPDNLKMPKSFGDIKAGTKAADLKKYTLSKLLDDMLFETIYPTVTNPTAAIHTNLYGDGQVVEIGSTAIKEGNLSTTFSKGNVHVADGTTTDTNYVGDKIGQMYIMPTNAAEKYSAFTSYSYSGVISYSEGPTMRTSKGASPNPIPTTNAGSVSNPHLSGTVNTNNTITVYASARMSGNTGSVYSKTMNPIGDLVRIDGNNKIDVSGVQFPGTAKDTPITIWSPKPIGLFKSFNSVSGKYDVDQLSNLKETREEKDFNGIKVNGYKYTWTGAALGTVKYQIITKNA